MQEENRQSPTVLDPFAGSGTIAGEYVKEKRTHQDAHRKRVSDRDGWRCRNCGRMTRIELAHITPAIEFWNYYGETGLARSYRDDNLVTLCRWCHGCHDRPEAVPEPIRLQVLRDERWCHILGGSPNQLVERFTQRIEWLEDEHRAKVQTTTARVRALFEQIVAERKWRTCADLDLLADAAKESVTASAA